jgi:hypothetical protein
MSRILALSIVAFFISAGAAFDSRAGVLTALKRPGHPVSAELLVRICEQFFAQPYSYMFDSTNAIKVGQRRFGTFTAGVKGIMLYGGLTGAISAVMGATKRDFYEMSPLEDLSRLKIHRPSAKDGRSQFRSIKPEIVRWGHQNLIPPPSQKILRVPAQRIYDHIFQRFFRTMTATYHYLESRAAAEEKAYLSGMTRPKFDGLSFLQQRYANVLTAYDRQADGTAMTVPMALGFWLRRGIDGSKAEVWRGLQKLMRSYDGKWLKLTLKSNS